MFDGEGLEGEGEVKAPGEAYHEYPCQGEGEWGDKDADYKAQQDNNNCIEGKEVGGKGNQDIDPGQAYAAAPWGDAEVAGASAEHDGPDGV